MGRTSTVINTLSSIPGSRDRDKFSFFTNLDIPIFPRAYTKGIS